MIRAALLALLFSLHAGGALAQEIRVRSGEHGAFTRLAFDIPVGTEWQLDQVAPREIELRFAGRSFTFDSSGVFDRIDTARLASLEQTPGGAGLDLGLGCACVAEAFLAAPDMLVIDIRPGEAAETATPETPGGAQQMPLSEIRVGALPGIGPAPARDPLLPGFAPQPAASEAERSAAETVAPAGELDPAALERRLAEQLAVAATDGLLSPGLRPFQATPSDEQSQSPSENRAAAASPPDLAGHGAAIEASILDRDPSDMRARVRIGGTGCVADAALEVSPWGDEQTFATALPDLRKRLYGEFDALDPEVLAELVRANIYIGFGAEARALLEMAPEHRDPVLYALAGIVDGEADRAGVFAGQTDCAGPASLWALAGAPVLPRDAQVDHRAIRRGFEALPDTLRKVLGPTLATRLAEAGHPEAGRNLLARLQRSGGAPEEDMRFSQAQIDRLEGAVDEATSALADLSHSAGAHAPDAVAATIELASSQGAPVTTRMTDLSAAYSTELRATEKGPDLWLAHLRALSANDLFQEGFATFRQGTDMPEETRKTGASELLLSLAERGSDTAFLQEAVARRATFETLVSGAVALAVAGRLLTLGLLDEALVWATLPTIERDNRDRRLLLSKVHLARSDPQQAEIALIGLQGEDALALRARARAMMGDYDYAQTAFGALGETGEARTAAWLAGDWGALAGEEDAISATADLVESELPASTGAIPSLELAEALATSGAETRDTLRALLDQTRLAED